MRIRVWAGAMALLLLLGSVRVTAAEDELQGERGEEMIKLLQLAIDRFDLGRYVEAKSALDKLLTKEPTHQEAWLLLQAVGEDAIHKMGSWMIKGRTIGEMPHELLKRARRFDREQLLSPDNIRRIVNELVRNPQKHPRLFVELARIGPRAVPYMIEYLRSGTDDVMRTNAAYLLVTLGPQMVVPVAETLSGGDSLLSQQLCDVLRQIRPYDARALPQLKRIYDNEKLLPIVRERARRSLEQISDQRVDVLPLAADMYYLEANRVYLGGLGVDDEMEDLLGTFWIWNPKGGPKGQGFLEFLEVPTFTLDDLMVQEYIYRGMALINGAAVAGDPKAALMLKRFQILLACALLQEAKEIESMNAIIDLEGITHPRMKAHEKEVKSWHDHRYKAQRVAYSVGPNMLVSALDKALMDGKIPVILAALQGIQVTGREKGWDMIKDWVPPLDGQPQNDTTKEKAPAEAEKSRTEGRDKPQADAVPPSPEKASAAKKPTPAHPVAVALNHSHKRVRFAAANLLARCGFPPNHPLYPRLIPTLVQGAQEKAAKVCLVISNNPRLRERFASLLEQRGIMAVTAPGGREGRALAVQFPPKDAILLDSRVEEFGYLQERLAMLQLVGGSPLPLVIITIRSRLDSIRQQFPEENWRVFTFTNVLPERNRLYEKLRSAQLSQGEKRIVALITNNNHQDRLRIKHMLLLEAERRGRPERQIKFLQIMRKKKLLSDIFAVRNSYINVFMDDELSGYNAMQTVQALRHDERTRHIPIALLTSPERRKWDEREFKEFLSNKADIRLLPFEIDAKGIFEQVTDMTNLNPMSRKNFVRKGSDRVAQDSAEALVMLRRHSGQVTLSPAEVNALAQELKDISRPLTVRAAIADALGYFGARQAAKSLAKVFREEPRQHLRLRVACMENLGRVDPQNNFSDVKHAALDEPDHPIQDAAVFALSQSTDLVKVRRQLFQRQHHNDPLKIHEKGLIKPRKGIQQERNPPPEVKPEPKEGEGEKEGEEKPKEGEEKKEKNGGIW